MTVVDLNPRLLEQVRWIARWQKVSAVFPPAPRLEVRFIALPHGVTFGPVSAFLDTDDFESLCRTNPCRSARIRVPEKAKGGFFDRLLGARNSISPWAPALSRR